ncbi:hypothetical protein TUM12370_24480 [Salmonella enterica subsp. enterica serovar Choleraesuis]|nr:hypothetical protein TUM12370_24480 [Salmonella enterica subsp. enterica serovar Choleraesuis]
MIATILMQPRSGMTTAACALAKGLGAILVIPQAADVEWLRLCRQDLIGDLQVINARDMASVITAVNSDVPLVFDDAPRCNDVWRQLGEGELRVYLETVRKGRGVSICRDYFFQYSI